MSECRTTVSGADGKMTVTTGDLRTVWKQGDDLAAATQVASLQQHVKELQTEIDRLREQVNDFEASLRSEERIRREAYSERNEALKRLRENCKEWLLDEKAR